MQEAPSPSRLARVSGAAQATLRRALSVAVTSAVSAVVLWVLLCWVPVRNGELYPWVAGLLLIVLLLPAAGTWLGVATVRGVLGLPRFLRSAASEGRGRIGELTEAAGGKGRARALGFVRLLWSLRGLALNARGRWAAAWGLFRLSRIPLLIGLAAAFVLNFAVIAAAVVAVLVVIA